MVLGRKPNSVDSKFLVHDSERPLVKSFIAYTPTTRFPGSYPHPAAGNGTDRFQWQPHMRQIHVNQL